MCGEACDRHFEVGTIEEGTGNARPTSIDKARHLTPDLRRAAEVLLAETFKRDESISTRAFKGDTAKEAPTGEARAEGFCRLIARIERTAVRAQTVPEADIDAIIDEAVEHVGPHHG
jgi:hypothetical protein